jgi:cyclopropane fatty-acyl-phospholipid synthase-like methyltransferase
MDLKEVSDNPQTHPWETARVNTLETILKKFTIQSDHWRVLDVGCGDAFVSSRLFRNFKVKIVEGIDIAFSDEQIKKMSHHTGHVVIHNDFSNLHEKKYDLVLMLDVLEHLKKDLAFLNVACRKYLAAGGYLLVTVPAYQSLYGNHDAFLKHYRRYSPNRLFTLLNSTGLVCEKRGQLFASLVPVRTLMLLYERVLRPPNNKRQGVGNWKWGDGITRCVAMVLTAENRLLLNLCTKGIRVPGLTVWALYRKLQS